MNIITCPICESLKTKKLEDNQIQCIICGHIGAKKEFEKDLKEREVRNLNEKFKDDKTLFITLCKEFKDMADSIGSDDLKVINRKLIALKNKVK